MKPRETVHPGRDAGFISEVPLPKTEPEKPKAAKKSAPKPTPDEE